MGKYGYTSNMRVQEKLMIALIRASELYKKECSLIFRNYRLTFPQYTVLRVLLGSEHGTNTMTNVSRVMLVSGPNMSGIAKRLERNGFIIRKEEPTDERVTLLEITPKGRQVLQNIEEEKDAVINKYLSPFGTDDISVFLERMKQILQIAKSKRRDLKPL